MVITVDRKWKLSTYTVGRLLIDGVFFCNTMEDTDKGLKSSMPSEEIKKIKKAGITAIPSGTYKVRMDIVSPKYSVKSWYYKNCHQGRLPRLENVPGFSGILIHPGNTAADSEGCILVGKNDVKGMVTKSKEYFLELYNKMYAAYLKKEEITIVVS